MMTMSEWMKIVEGTQTMHEVSKRLGLGQPDMHKAVEALMPAFMLGGMKMGQFGQIGMPGGNPFAAILEQNTIKEAVAQQAAMLSGLNEKILVDMMPSLAKAMADAMEQLAKAGGFSSASNSTSDELGTALGGMMAAMMGLTPAKDQKAPQNPAEFGMNAMQDWMNFGKSAQADYVKAVESIFSGMRKPD